ncbi:hypothetical protein H8711_08130 [Clostridiaceae bacterium NSJ-31]|uniref:ResB-like family protein n=1 Tax=Ligaoa zhengdingensis TaxID=2763658 RepID=A0A926E0N3_9FIRM|nr:cytochrome c biogenesis protein ResB [Ligaoa zhengdingensis]MBC8546899.1 hypothetical protein [Ligaoa zhengdingensis]
MKLMKPSVALMAVLTAVLIVCSLVMGVNHEFKYYENPAFLLLVAVFTAVQILCIIKYKPQWKKIGFYICHIGLVVLIIGSFVSFFTVREVNFNIPIDARAAYSVVQKEDGSEVDFGFNISILDFQVEQYDPDYRLYQPDPSAPDGYSVLKETVILNRKGFYDLGNGRGTVAKEELMDQTGFLDSYETPDGLLLEKLPPADRQYEAHMRILDGDQYEVLLRVNEPCIYRGWKFYLMDYDHDGGSYVSLYVKNDPGNLPMRIGIWMLILGTAIMCFKVFDRKGDATDGVH